MNEWNQSFGPSELRLNRDGYRNASGWAYFMTRFLIMKGKSSAPPSAEVLTAA